MKKLRLDPDQLRIESFGTAADVAPARGTVEAHESEWDPTACGSCGGSCYGQPTCQGYNTCRQTCYGWYTCDGYDTCLYSCGCPPTEYFGGGCPSYDAACYPDPV